MDAKKKRNLLLGLSGSIATIKYQPLIRHFLAQSFSIKVICTKNSTFFLEETHKKEKKITFLEFPGMEVPVYFDEDEWTWTQRGDPILHIELRKWADVFLIAPLSANTLAKISNGICDNLLTSVARAWDLREIEPKNKITVQGKEYSLLQKAFIVAPAMNTFMFEHPITEEQINKLQKFNIMVLNTIEKLLPCGDKGLGAMEEPEHICKITLEIFNKRP